MEFLVAKPKGLPLGLLERCSSRPRGVACLFAAQRLQSRCRRHPARRCYATHRQQQQQQLDLPSLDRKWRKIWQDARSNAAPTSKAGKGKQYVLPMFPYPSGSLHLGHLRVYAIADVIARFRQLQGHDVLLPMGWDAFGLPAENAALERGVAPGEWTKENIAKMKEQLGVMNGSWDWEREITTCDPKFYKHTQAIFLMLHERGLAYQAEAQVNYDPVDKTVLANEQVGSNGRSWRSGAKVEKRLLKQWFFKISAFREELLRDLQVLEKDGAWPTRVLAQQKNWLGKSTGTMIKFPVMAAGHDIHAALDVFTTRPDTLFGVQYLALASTHPVVATLAKKDPELQAFLDTLPALPPDSKVGYLLPHLRAVNPLAYHEDTPDAAKESIPVYVAPYVLGDYGVGAVMGVPAHDERDHRFWKEHHYDEPVRYVIAASEDESTTAMANQPVTGHGYMTAHSGPYEGKLSREAGEMLVKMLEAAGLAARIEKWRLRDWLISRQRYWGTPIPIVHCDGCGAVPVPKEELPVELPELDEHWVKGRTGNPLEEAREWVETKCPRCRGPARRDTDTMDTFVDSSWYYARFVDPRNEEQPLSKEAWDLLPVDLYIGGVEHAILHLLYARFLYKFLATAGAGGAEGVYEPFTRLITQGMVHGKTYTDPTTGKFLKPDEVDLSDPAKPRALASGRPATVTFEKMSKSKHNGVDPTAFIAAYGADATRAHMLFQAPVGEVLNWDEEKISGVTRWLARVWQQVGKVERNVRGAPRSYLEGQYARLQHLEEKERKAWEEEVRLWRLVQETIGAVTAAYEEVYSLNTAVSGLMSLTKAIVDRQGPEISPVVEHAATATLVGLMAPIVPAFASECHAALSSSDGHLFQPGGVRFPVQDGTLEMEMMRPRAMTCVVQVNGKVRATVKLSLAGAGDAGGEENGLGRDEWVVERVKGTEEGGRLRFKGRKLEEASRVVVARGGRVVNFVFG